MLMKIIIIIIIIVIKNNHLNNNNPKNDNENKSILLFKSAESLDEPHNYRLKCEKILSHDLAATVQDN